MSEWDDGFAMYCGQEWKTDDDHTHECRRSPGHSVIDSFHIASGGTRVDHWCYCGSKTYPRTHAAHIYEPCSCGDESCELSVCVLCEHVN